MEDILLRALAAKKSKEFILTHPEYHFTFWQKLRLKYFCYLRHQGWSIAHIAGQREFYGLNFIVNKHTLIPRPETELLVEEVLGEISKSKFVTSNQIKNQKSKNVILIDVGTGTGCIPITIGKILDTKDIRILASDVSRRALAIAKKNARIHNIKINFIQSDLLNKKIISQFLNIPMSSLFITANLPYLTAKQFAEESSIQKEPKNALVADDKDGLSLYEKLLKQIKSLISNIQYFNIFIFLEIDPSQTINIKKIIKNILPASNIEIKNDLAGRDRLVVIRVN